MIIMPKILLCRVTVEIFRLDERYSASPYPSLVRLFEKNLHREHAMKVNPFLDMFRMNQLRIINIQFLIFLELALKP
jgi:hypothetical protein